MDDLLAIERYRKTSNHSALSVTAIPAGRNWRLKAIGLNGSVNLPDIFTSRLEALGAGVLLAAQVDGRVLP